MRRALLLSTLLVPALLAGCSAGKSEFNGNRPDPSANQQEVVRTPSPVGTDLPYSQPPIVQTPPGPTGGLINDPPTTAAPASPGEGGDGGGPPAN